MRQGHAWLGGLVATDSTPENCRRSSGNQLTLGGQMIPVSKALKMRIEELKTMRKPLWERFESNPTEIQLAAELRIIDDLIADCNEKRNLRVSQNGPNPDSAAVSVLWR
jgi:hypothetical protein